MQYIANGWLVLQMTHSNLSVAFVLIASTLPGVLLAPIVGVYVDRFDRKILTASMDLFRACVLLGIPLLWWLHQLQPWHLYLMAFFLGVGDYTYNTSVLGLIREVVPAEQLLLANATTGVAAQVGGAVGAVLAGLIIIVSSPVVIMVVNAATFLFSAGCISAMRKGYRPPREIRSPVHNNWQQFWREFTEGIDYIRNHLHLIALYSVMLVILATLRTINVLLPSFAKEVLTVGPAGFGYVDSMFGVGAVVGSLLLPAFSAPKVSAWAMPGAVLLLAVSLGLFANSHQLSMAMFTYFLIGLAYPVRILYLTTAQHGTDLEVQGRVHTTFGIFFTLATIAVYLVMGVLSETTSLRWLYAGQGCLVAITGVLSLLVPLRGTRLLLRYARD